MLPRLAPKDRKHLDAVLLEGLDGAGHPVDFVTPVGEWDVGIEIAFC